MARTTGLNISGIYKIESSVHPDRLYIGSAVCIRRRKNDHFWSLENQTHKNPKLQAHYNKYGKDDLIFSVIAICNKGDLMPTDGVIWLEQLFINAYKPWFNIAKIAGSNIGIKRSKETIKKLTGRVVSEESRQKNREAHLALNSTPWNKGLTKDTNDVIKEMGRKISIANKGKKSKQRGVKRSAETCDKLSKSHFGLKDTEETKKRKSMAGKHKPPVSQETREKLRIANTGKIKPPATEEYKKKQSEIMYEWWRKRKEINEKVA